MTEPTVRPNVTTVAELAPFLERIEDMAAEGWDRFDGRFDWEAFLARVERYLDIDLPSQMDDPVILRLQRAARHAAKEAGL